MLILDRKEDGIAYVSTDEGMLCLDCRLLAGDVCEGDVLHICGSHYVRDDLATNARKERILKLLKNRLNLRT